MLTRAHGGERRSVLARAALAGGGGGLVLVASDFFSLWMWLPAIEDRVLLGFRLLGLLPALGAIIAAAVVLLDRAVRPALRRARRPSLLAPVPVLVVLTPAVIALSIELFSGGRTSRLPLRWLWIAGAGLALLVVLYVALRVARRIARSRYRPALSRTALALVLFAAALLAAKADQTLYPRHYAGLHAVLAALGWASASLGVWTILPLSFGRAPVRVLVPALALVLAITLLSLPNDHDGRAALLSPRCPSARSVMLAVAPAMWGLSRSHASADAIDRARRARAARRGELAAGQLPRWDGAHVVLVTIDALRADHLGVYGYTRPISPSIDRWAEGAVVFERAWTPTPRSSYSVCSLMTGVALHPRVEGGLTLPPATLADLLRAHGHHTAAFYPEGIFFHEGARLDAYRARELGFERRDAENHRAESLTDALLAELDDLRRRGEPPAFLWAHYFDVHEPYEERALGDAPVDRYDGEIRNVDRAFARLLEGLRALSREVVLVVTADHGEEHRDHGGLFHGGSLYEEQLRVPLILAAPGLSPRRVETPVSLIDLAPTLAAMVGAGAPDSAEGCDLRPALVGRAFDRGPIRATENGMRAILRWPDKLIEDERAGTIEIYDLLRDPAERSSVADVRAELLEELVAELAAL